MLDNEKRVIVQDGMLKALGISRGGRGERLANFVTQNRIIKFINKELEEGIKNPIKFKIPSGIAVILKYD